MGIVQMQIFSYVLLPDEISIKDTGLVGAILRLHPKIFIKKGAYPTNGIDPCNL
jgi:hypothetical protein